MFTISEKKKGKKKIIFYRCKRCGYTWSGEVPRKYCPFCYRQDIEAVVEETILSKLKKKMSHTVLQILQIFHMLREKLTILLTYYRDVLGMVLESITAIVMILVVIYAVFKILFCS